MSYEYPKYKRRKVNKYVRKYSDVENCISYDVMKHMMENAHLYPTLEMADNALSRYIALKGKCAVIQVRFYDPDRHIIEVGENMKAVCKRFIDSGMTPEQTAERMDVPVEYVNECMQQREQLKCNYGKPNRAKSGICGADIL